MDLFNILDMQQEIVKHLDYIDLVHFSSTNKKWYHNDVIWQIILSRDYSFLYSEENTKKLYHSYFIFFDKWTTNIIGKFIKYKTKYINMNTIYNKINTILINYVSKHCVLEDNKADTKQFDTLLLNTIYLLFSVLTIPIDQYFTINNLYPPRQITKANDIGKIVCMRTLFEKLHSDFEICDMEW